MGVSKRFRISSRPRWVFSLDVKEWMEQRMTGLTLHLCCGLTRFTRFPCVNVDIDPDADVDVVADMFHLPFRSGVFDTVVCDPPYRLALHRRVAWVREVMRVIRKRQGSRILLKIDFIPYFGRGWELRELVVYQGAKYWAPVSLLLHYLLGHTLLDF